VFAEDHLGSSAVLGRRLRFLCESDSEGVFDVGPWLGIVGVVEHHENERALYRRRLTSLAALNPVDAQKLEPGKWTDDGSFPFSDVKLNDETLTFELHTRPQRRLRPEDRGFSLGGRVARDAR